MRKKKLTVSEYKKLKEKIEVIMNAYDEVFHLVVGNFPKNSMTTKCLRGFSIRISRLYYQIEREFITDYPEEEF